MIKPASIKITLLSFASSVLALSLIFMLTSYKHYGHIELEYYQGIIIPLFAISLVPALLVAASKITKWYYSVGIGVVVGFTGAVAYVKISNNI